MAKNEGMSLNPEDFTEGGGLLDDVIVTFNEARFEMFDYQGKSPNPVPALKIGMEDGDGVEVEQYYSMGNAQDWAPSTDGKMLVAVGSATGIRSQSNGGIFLKSLMDSGFPADKVGNDITVFEGLQCHVIRIPAPKRPGVKKAKRADGREFEDTILVVDEIVSLPGEKKKPTGAPKTKAKGKAAGKGKAAATPIAGLADKAKEAVVAILLEHGDVDRKRLPVLMFQMMKDDPDRNDISKLVFTDEFLASGDWTYDSESGKLSME